MTYVLLGYLNGSWATDAPSWWWFLNNGENTLNWYQRAHRLLGVLT